MTKLGNIELSARADRKYRCYNCGAEFRVFKVLPQHVKRGAQDQNEYTLNRHLADNPRCSEAVRAYDLTGNSDHLDNPPQSREIHL
jgi:DNA-directed RNA polymerase subunit RPC12/RpoP